MTLPVAAYNAEPMPESSAARFRVGSVVALIAAVSVAHYATPPEHFLFHNVYQRLYYIPILLACAWYGLAGGLAASAVSAIAYTPHILLHWRHSEAYQASQILELAMFGVVALVAGLLSDRERALRLHAEETALERDRALRELEATVENLRRADRLAALGTLTAGMAHEIRNPLGAIGGAAEILEQDYAREHPRREFVEILRREIARLNAIVGKYLDYARPEAPELRPVDVNAVVAAAVDLVSKGAARSAVSFTTRPAAGDPRVLADPGQMQQVLVNLLLNAVQAMPEGGLVEVDTTERGDAVEIVVRDHGPGLADVPAERLFEPFFTTRPGGTGLGLHVSRKIVDSHGGRIEAGDAPGKGALVRVVLPKRKEAAP